MSAEAGPTPSDQANAAEGWTPEQQQEYESYQANYQQNYDENAQANYQQNYDQNGGAEGYDAQQYYDQQNYQNGYDQTYYQNGEQQQQNGYDQTYYQNGEQQQQNGYDQNYYQNGEQQQQNGYDQNYYQNGEQQQQNGYDQNYYQNGEQQQQNYQYDYDQQNYQYQQQEGYAENQYNQKMPENPDEQQNASNQIDTNGEQKTNDENGEMQKPVDETNEIQKEDDIKDQSKDDVVTPEKRIEGDSIKDLNEEDVKTPEIHKKYDVDETEKEQEQYNDMSTKDKAVDNDNDYSSNRFANDETEAYSIFSESSKYDNKSHTPRMPLTGKQESKFSSPRLPRYQTTAITPKSSPRPKVVYSPPPAYTPDPYYPEAKLEIILKDIIKTSKPPTDKACIQPALKYAVHRIELMVKDQNYDRANFYEKCADFLRNICDKSVYERELANEKAENQSRLNDAKHRSAELEKKWENMLAQQEATHQRLLQRLEERNSSEMADFEAKWENDEFLAQYNKPSAKLLSLRSIEQTFAAAKLFDRAKEVKRQADELQAREMADMRGKAVEDMKLQYQTLASKHQNSLDCFKQYVEREKHNLELKKKREMYGLEMLIKRMESPLTPVSKVRPLGEQATVGSRPLRKGGIKNSPQFSIGRISIRQIIKSPSVMSPRKKRQ